MTIPELGTIRARAPADRRADLEPHARPARRAQAPLPLPLDRLPGAGARGRDRAPARPGRARRSSRPTWPRAVAPAARRATCRSRPGIAEAIDWVAALELLGVERLDAAAADRTLGAVLKYREDQELVRERGLDGAGGRRWLSCRLEPAPPLAPRVRARAARRRAPGHARARRCASRARCSCAPPVTRTQLYWTARTVFVSSRDQVARVRRGVRRGLRRRSSIPPTRAATRRRRRWRAPSAGERAPAGRRRRRRRAAARRRPAGRGAAGRARRGRARARGPPCAVASAEERLADEGLRRARRPTSCSRCGG